MCGHASSREKLEIWFYSWMSCGEMVGDMPTSSFRLLRGSQSAPSQSNQKPEPQTAVRKVHSQVPSREKLGDECSCLLLLFWAGKEELQKVLVCPFGNCFFCCCLIWSYGTCRCQALVAIRVRWLGNLFLEWQNLEHFMCGQFLSRKKLTIWIFVVVEVSQGENMGQVPSSFLGLLGRS